ncbi:MAG: hypothetical protein Q4B57_08420 [Eubacteriales bacterium]|nr:hypothetical protein [Eubacteriales bacterium]
MKSLSKVRKTGVAIFAAVLCVSAIQTVRSAWNITGKTGNLLTMATYQNRIMEEYETPAYVEPSQKISKIVNVTNTGTVDTLVRVSVDKGFGMRGADGSFVKDTSLDPEMIEITFNNTWWLERGDGYYYYKEVLKAGETTKEPLMTSYTLSKKAGNNYRGKEAQVLVGMESVQAAGGAVSLWGVRYQDLGISAPPAPLSSETQVNYLGREQGFDVSESKTDLFASFKNLLPGCSRTQKIKVRNSSYNKVELMLRAEAADQKKMSKEQKRLIKQLLDKYATIQIKSGGRVLYNGSVSGNLSGKGDSMKQDISLGEFSAMSTKNLTVKLSLSPKMDNQYQKLTGKVRWIFTATGEEASAGGSGVSTAVSPKTGDNTRVQMWFALFCTSALALIVALRIGRRAKKAQEEE